MHRQTRKFQSGNMVTR